MVDKVRATEPTASIGGPQTISVVGGALLEVQFERERARRAEARVAELERVASWTAGRVAEYEARIAHLEAHARVGALETRQARRDRVWVIGICAVTMVLGFALILALAWATGPR